MIHWPLVLKMGCTENYNFVERYMAFNNYYKWKKNGRGQAENVNVMKLE